MQAFTKLARHRNCASVRIVQGIVYNDIAGVQVRCHAARGAEHDHCLRRPWQTRVELRHDPWCPESGLDDLHCIAVRVEHLQRAQKLVCLIF